MNTDNRSGKLREQNIRIQEAENELLDHGILAWKEGREAEALELLRTAQNSGNMKAGRYLALIYLQQAAGRGDITAKVILGMLCEYGLGMEADTCRAKEYYLSALEDDHPNKEGFMLAAGADLGMGRILCTETLQNPAAKTECSNTAGRHLSAAEKGGDPKIRREAMVWKALSDQC